MRRLILAALLLGAAAPAAAATRSYSVTDFDRLRLAGAYEVEVRTGPGPSARAEGDQAAIDLLRVTVQGRTLVVQPDRTLASTRDGMRGGARLLVTVPALIGASLSGAGRLSVDRVKAARFDASVAGSGGLRVGEVAVERLSVAIIGAGTVEIGGKAAAARIGAQGAGSFKGEALSVADAELDADGAATIALTATRTARIRAAGPSDVTILGSPSCTITASGTGSIRCGRD